jgi:hypothetical protein
MDIKECKISLVEESQAKEISDSNSETEIPIVETLSQAYDDTEHESSFGLNTRTKIYRLLGLILLTWGIIGFYSYCGQKVTEAEEKGVVMLTFPFVMGIFSMYIINPFFWAGWILLHKATKLDQTTKKPTWLQWLLKSYIICGWVLAVSVLIMLAVLVLLMGIDTLRVVLK